MLDCVTIILCDCADNHDIISMKLYDIGVVRKVGSISVLFVFMHRDFFRVVYCT
jgi:hypothetical protein